MNSHTLTAAHKSLPFGTKLLVENMSTGRSVVVTVNDRGPFNNRIVDVSQAAAEVLGMVHSGIAHVKLAPLPPNLVLTDGDTLQVAEATSRFSREHTVKVLPIVRPLHPAKVRVQRHSMKKSAAKNSHRQRGQTR